MDDRSRSWRGLAPSRLGRGRCMVPELRDRVRDWEVLGAGDCDNRCCLIPTLFPGVVRAEPFAVALPPTFPLTSARNCVAASGEDVAGFAPAREVLLTYCCCAARVCRLSDCGCSSRGSVFVRDDRRLPSSVNVVGPSAPGFFQGGEGCLERRDGVVSVGASNGVSVSLRFFDGGSSVCCVVSWSCGSEWIDS